MERFNLNTWLEDKSRKVIDDDGFPGEIIKWDANEKYPVVFLNHKGFAYNVSTDGMYDADPNHGLCFADDEEELTEFEKKVLEISGKNYNYVPSIKVDAQILLDLARKEFLKDLPKWKKCAGSNGPFIDDFRGEDYLYLKDYVIKVSELFEKLPKEE